MVPEGKSAELRLGRAQLVELFADVPFGEPGGFDCLFQPHQEAHHGHTIVLVGGADVLQFHMVFHHLEMFDDVIFQQDTVHPFAQAVVDGSIDGPC